VNLTIPNPELLATCRKEGKREGFLRWADAGGIINLLSYFRFSGEKK
jgi:hypothetical protein